MFEFDNAVGKRGTVFIEEDPDKMRLTKVARNVKRVVTNTSSSQIVMSEEKEAGQSMSYNVEQSREVSVPIIKDQEIGPIKKKLKIRRF